MGESEDLVYIDRKMLGSCGVRRPVFSQSGVKTATFLAKLPKSQHPAFIFCAGLADMDSLRFLELIRLHPSLSDLPVILVMSSLTSQVIVETAKLGACALLARPYTQAEMENAVLTAGKEKSRLEPCPDASMFEQALKSLDSGEKTTRKTKDSPAKPDVSELMLGKSLLRQGKYQQATAAFMNHLDKQATEKGLALHGIATAKAALGQPAKSQRYMQQAAVAYIEEEDFMAARTLFAKLKQDKDGKSTDNPLYQAGARLLREGRFSAAAQAFMQGQVLTPDISFHVHASRACQFAADPERCAEELCWHVEKRNPSLGRQLRSYLLMPATRTAEPEWESRSGLWGLICEVIEVARYTAKVHTAS